MNRTYLLASAFLALAFTLGCGSSSSNDLAPNPDATSDGTANQAEGSTSDDTGTGATDGNTTNPDSGAPSDAAGSTDGTAPHDASSSGADSSITDAALFDTSTFDVLAADGACACQPYWCGCGTCDPNRISCTPNPPVCALGCLSSCPELAQVTCTCDQGRCIRGGVPDASFTGCRQDVDCPPGDCCALHSPGGSCVAAPNNCCAGSGTPCP